jgi:thymidylate synthase (FAD)
MPDAIVARFNEELERVIASIHWARKQLGVDDMPMAERKRWTSALRRVMPSGADNEMGWTVNVRALRHLIELRTSPHAEWEIRRVFTDVARIVRDKWPLMLAGGEVEHDEENDLEIWTGLRV